MHILHAESLCTAVLLACILAHARGETLRIESSHSISCPFTTWDISQSNMYNIAFAWTHHQTLNKWSYMPAKEINASMQCVAIQYSAPIVIPKFFRSYTFSNLLFADVSKRICVQDNRLSESVIVYGVPFVETFKMTISASVNTDKVEYKSYSDIATPWWLVVLSSQIKEHVRKSIMQYLHILTASLCT